MVKSYDWGTKILDRKYAPSPFDFFFFFLLNKDDYFFTWIHLNIDLGSIASNQVKCICMFLLDISVDHVQFYFTKLRDNKNTNV